MKKVYALIMLITTVLAANAQTANFENVRKIATKGYAEKEITPDIVYLSISLKEFYMDGNLKKKVYIETLEKQLFDAAIASGVKKEDFTIQNIFSYNTQNKKKINELLQSRQYRIKVTNLNGLNAMMDKINPQALQSTSIESYDYSNKKEIEKELKTIAVKDARNNANILAAAAGQEVSTVLVINDNSNFNLNDMMPQPRYVFAKAAMANAESMDVQDLNIDIRPIKLTCYIDCIFAIK